MVLQDKIAFGAAILWIGLCMSYIMQPLQLPDFRNGDQDVEEPTPAPAPTPAPGPTPAPTPAPTPDPQKETQKKLERDLQRELITDSTMLGVKLGEVQGLYVLTPLPLIVIFSAMTGCIKAPWAKTTNVIHRRMCPFLLFMLTGAVWAKRTLVREIEEAFVVFDESVLPETVSNFTESFLSDIMMNLLALARGDEMLWNLAFRNLLDTPLVLETVTADLSIITTEEIKLVELELQERVEVEASSLQKQPAHLPLRTTLDQAGTAITLFLASIVTWRNGVVRFSLDANMTTRINDRGLDMTIKVNFPLDLSVFGALIQLPGGGGGGGGTGPGGIINPNFTAPHAVLESIIEGFRKMHNEDPPTYLVDPESITASGYFVYFAFGIVGCIYVLFGAMAQMASFLFLRNCYEVGITVDDPIVLDADGAGDIEITNLPRRSQRRSTMHDASSMQPMNAKENSK